MAAKKTKSRSKSINFESLYKWNIGLAVLFGLQAVAILIFSKSVSLPVVTHYLAPDTLASQAAGHNVMALAVRHAFDIRLAYLVAAFLLISALVHFLLTTNLRKRYEKDLKQGFNQLRWINYALSSGIMLIAIAMLNGIYDVSTILTIFVLVVLLNLLAFLGEINTATRRVQRHSFLGLITAGGAVWLVVAAYIKGALLYGNGLPHYVYWLDVSIFVLTLFMAANIWLVFRAKGKWANYLYGEQIYMIISFVVKTALAWQIFFGILR